MTFPRSPFPSSVPGSTPEELIAAIYGVLLRRVPSEDEVRHLRSVVESGAIEWTDLPLRISLGHEFLGQLLRDPVRHHLHVLHQARLKLIRCFLPAAKRILDVGGANGSMLDYGFPHAFDELILTDIPPDQRIPELRDIDLTQKWKHRGNVRVLYTSLSDLSAVPDGSIDLVWVGQVVEHIPVEELPVAFREIHRVLSPAGRYCFDTPNGIMTRIHSPDALIHPEHKKEYTPAELEALIADAGFEIEEQLGLVPMPRSHRTRKFSYEEMVLNPGFSRDLESSYIVYYACRRRG